MRLELHQLELRYADSHIRSPARQARLMAELAQEGQRSPVLCFLDGERFVLVDGYCRVWALGELGRDEVEAVALDLCETDALLLRFRMVTERPDSPLERAWLLSELKDRQKLSHSELARRLGRSVSWISRQLALARSLPSCVQEAIRKGRISPQAAMRSLVPLARANPLHCERLVANLGPRRTSVRELKALHRAWQEADAAGRERLVDHPGLFLDTLTELERPEPPVPDSSVAGLLRDLDLLLGACRRARFKARHWRENGRPLAAQVLPLADELRAAVASFLPLFTGEPDARPGDPAGDPAPEEGRPRHAGDRPGAGDKPQRSAGGDRQRPGRGARRGAVVGAGAGG